MQRTPTFCPFCTHDDHENLENSSLKIETKRVSQSMTYTSGSVLGHSLRRKFLKMLHFLPEKLQHTQKRKTARDCLW